MPFLTQFLTGLGTDTGRDLDPPVTTQVVVNLTYWTIWEVNPGLPCASPTPDQHAKFGACTTKCMVVLLLGSTTTLHLCRNPTEAVLLFLKHPLWQQSIKRASSHSRGHPVHSSPLEQYPHCNPTESAQNRSMLLRAQTELCCQSCIVITQRQKLDCH